MTDILAESYTDNIKRTFAGISISGCMKMIDSYGIDGSNMADTWTVFGDPTIMVRTSLPENLTADHDSTMLVGDSSFMLTSSVNGARATLTVADSILASGIFENDTLILAFPSLTIASDTIHLVVTAYNNIPYQFDLPVKDLVILPVAAAFTGVPESVIPGDSVSFADTSFGTVIYREWLFDGGTPSTSMEKNPVVTYSERGSYDVRLVVGNALGYDTLHKTAYIMCDFPTSVNASEQSTGIYVSPNPNSGKFAITGKGIFGDSGAQVTIYNVVGAQVYQRSKVMLSNPDREEFDLDNLPKGIYFVRIMNKNTNTTIKVVIR
jgi:gingipain R